MPRAKKLNDELNMNEDRTVIVKKEDVKLPEIPEVSETSIKQKVKREMSDKQRENLQRLIEANKKKWEDKRNAEQKTQEESQKAQKEDEEKKLASGDYIKIKVKEKRTYQRKKEPQPSSSSSSSSSETPTETETETETETDIEEYKGKQRQARREVKKTLKTLKKIDQVLDAHPVPPSNPYLAYLQNKWH